MEDHILRNRNHQSSFKATDQVKSNVEMDHHQEIYEKENYNPKSLKEILTGSEKDSSKTGPLPVQDITDCNDTFTHEIEVVKFSENTFDQTSDDESYISTNESLGFLTEGFNNMQLESDGRRSLARSPLSNSTMHVDSQPLFEPSVNMTLTIESPPISECSQKSNTTITGDKTQDIEVVQSPQQTENYSEMSEGLFPETICEYIQKADTIDEIAAAIACPAAVEETNDTEDLKPDDNMAPISPIYPSAEPSIGYVSANETPMMNDHEINITSSATIETSSLLPVEKSQEVEIELIEPSEIDSSIKLQPENPQELNSSVPQQADTSTTSVNSQEVCNSFHKHHNNDNLSIPMSSENDEKNSSMLQQADANTVSATFVNSQETCDSFQSHHNNDNLSIPMCSENEKNSTLPINRECSRDVNLTMEIPMEIDQTMGEDITSTQEQDVITVVEQEAEKPQQVFECDFVSQSVQQLQFEFKTPEIKQKVELDDLHKTLEMESPPTAELHQSSEEAEKSRDDFKVPSMPKRLSVEKFESAATYNFGNFDFDVLQKCGSNTPADFSIGRDSVLLRFDPLLEKLAPVETINQRLTPTAISTTRLASTEEEEEFYLEGQGLSEKQPEEELIPVESFTSPTNCISSLYTSPPSLSSNAEISAMKDLDQGNETIESVNETKDQFKDINISDNNQQLLQQQEIEFKQKMTELESQLRKEAEIKEEALLKRITEKEKQMAKMSNVVEAYEKTIATLIAEKEQLIQSYEKKCLELKSDSEQNYHHLASLESTFSDLHAKYERTKQLASELKNNEESIIQDRKSLQESLKLQEARYEKMKMHAMSQLEIANNKLAEMQRNHQADTTKLKAQLKKEEISRASINEQLIQKSKENAELVKICDELIGNHGHSQNA